MTNVRILFSVLDWGLGHASRCVPITKELLEIGVEVVVAGSGNSLSLLEKEFPDLEFIDLPNYPIKYPKSSFLFLHMMKQFPSMNRFVKKEYEALRSILEAREFSAVISDNRYGLHNKNLPCVFITHQLHPPVGLFSNWMGRYLMRHIEQFDHCWIVDVEGKNAMAGKMSQKKSLKINATYLGPLSRFKPKELPKKTDVLAILSGPEPQRSLLETEILEQLSFVEGAHCVIRGVESPAPIAEVAPNIEIIDLLEGHELENRIHTSKYLVSRSGYSSLMDYMTLGRKALIVPTPGQPEQEYLAKLHASRGRFVVQKQRDLNLKQAFSEFSDMPTPTPVSTDVLLKDVLKDFCEALY